MSIIKHEEQRVGIFIDAQNLYHSAKHLFHGAVNFSNIVEQALANRKLIRSIAYVIKSESGEEQSFFDALNKAGIETRVKDLQVFAGGAKKADWDVGIAVDMITLSARLDAVILISGDGDFVPAVKYVQTHTGAQVEVVGFKASTSSLLVDVADDFIDLSEDPKQFIINKGNRGGRSKQRQTKKKSTKQTAKKKTSNNKQSTSNVTIKKAVPKNTKKS